MSRADLCRHLPHRPDGGRPARQEYHAHLLKRTARRSPRRSPTSSRSSTRRPTSSTRMRKCGRRALRTGSSFRYARRRLRRGHLGRLPRPADRGRLQREERQAGARFQRLQHAGSRVPPARAARRTSTGRRASPRCGGPRAAAPTARKSSSPRPGTSSSPARWATAIGRGSIVNGYNGWYGPALNIHRSPFSGRNFEYYSEDAYLSGVICAAVVEGARGQGLLRLYQAFRAQRHRSQAHHQPEHAI